LKGLYTVRITGRLPELHIYSNEKLEDLDKNNKIMETIKLKKPKKKVKINHLIKNDQVELRTEGGSILRCKIHYVGLNGENCYTGPVINLHKTKEGIHPGHLVDFFIENVYEVLRVGPEYQFATIKDLHDMLEAGCSNDEILKEVEHNLEMDMLMFNEKMQRKTMINNGIAPFFSSVWDQFSYNSVYEVKSKFGK